MESYLIPQPVHFQETLRIVEGLRKALPDIYIDVQQVSVDCNQANLRAHWGGT
jgi:hypothetical protein